MLYRHGSVSQDEPSGEAFRMLGMILILWNYGQDGKMITWEEVEKQLGGERYPDYGVRSTVASLWRRE
jgi:hypothetical protein